MNISINDLLGAFENDPQSANFGSIIIETDARNGFKVNHADGTKFPYAKGELIKVSRYQINLGVKYSDAMNRALDGEYEAGKCWFTHYRFPNGKVAKNIVQSKSSGELYICFMPDFERSSSYFKLSASGKVVDGADLKKFKKPSDQRVVPFLTSKLSNVKAIKMRGNDYNID
jgi:hypothetical protein